MQVGSGDDDELADDDKFLAVLNEAFDAGEFTDTDRRIVEKKVCQKYRVASVVELALEKRHALFKAVVAGEMDRFKLKAPATA